MAYHGLQLQIPVTLVMPITAPIMKVSGCRGFNAEVILKGNDICEYIKSRNITQLCLIKDLFVNEAFPEVTEFMT